LPLRVKMSVTTLAYTRWRHERRATRVRSTDKKDDERTLLQQLDSKLLELNKLSGKIVWRSWNVLGKSSNVCEERSENECTRVYMTHYANM